MERPFVTQLEPSGGSNAGDPKTRAVFRNGMWRVSGSKAFNTNGWVADTFVITANQPMVEDTTVNFQVGGSATAGVDYQVVSGVVLMRAGSSSITVSVRTFSDDVIFYPSDMIVANWPARVGTALGIAEGTSKARVFDARARLRKALAPFLKERTE